MNLAGMIDQTCLKPYGDGTEVVKLCREAKKHVFASVCVHPCEVSRAAKLLKGTKVAVCTVIGFPLGQNTPAVKLCEALDALANGATELDFVVNVFKLKAAVAKGANSREAKRLTSAWSQIVSSVKAARPSVVTKLIIECCYLTRGEKVFAAKMCRKAGFDYVKTSTGFGSGGATVEDVKLLRKAVGPQTGVKAAGGIRTKADALAMIAAGATRLGCSVGVAIVL